MKEIRLSDHEMKRWQGDTGLSKLELMGVLCSLNAIVGPQLARLVEPPERDDY